jgi:hypothetical protein
MSGYYGAFGEARTYRIAVNRANLRTEEEYFQPAI